MAPLFSGDRQARDSHFDAAIAEFHAALGEDSVQYYLGRTALAFQNYAANARLIHAKNGVLSLPRKLLRREPSALPVAVLHPGETIILDQTFAGNSETQYRSAWEQFETMGPKMGDESMLFGMTRMLQAWELSRDETQSFTVPAENPPASIAAVRSAVITDINNTHFVSFGKQQERSLLGIPALGLIHDQDRPQLAPSRGLVHGLFHIMNIINKPVLGTTSAKNERRFISEELQAGLIEWLYCYGLSKSTITKFAGNTHLVTEGYEVALLTQLTHLTAQLPFGRDNVLKTAVLDRGFDQIIL